MLKNKMKSIIFLATTLIAVSCADSNSNNTNNTFNNTNNTNNNVEDADNDNYTVAQGDCDDNNEFINPGAVEVADGIDNNCDGFIDDDYDGDGFGVADDCDDTNRYINPAAEELCDDGIDNNCNGIYDSAEDCIGGTDPCPDELKLIYVVDRDTKELLKFDPANLSFESVGTLSCGGGNTPGSMGITRDGLGYVVFSDESLFEIDTETADCSATSYSDAQTEFGAFGMGFSSDSVGSEDETLYVANATTLGILDTAAWTISTVGSMSSQAEVTGTGEGGLWAILPLEGRVVKLNKANAEETESHDLVDFPDPMNIDTFAFAHWGAALWIFIREYGMGETTNVYKFDNTSHTFTLQLEDTGYNITGAGVSTCAPYIVQ